MKTFQLFILFFVRYPQPFIFKPKHPEKYAGDPNNIVARSKLESRFFKHFDEDSRIKIWSSEEIYCRYRSPVDGRIHRYFIDVVLQTINDEIFAVEIKPKSQTVPPKVNKSSKKILREAATFAINQAKWEAAQAFCQEKNWKFIIMTEDTLKHNL